MWVRRDLWRAKTFAPSDCYPFGEGDVWIEPPSKLKFTELFWGDEKKASFAQVVKGAMAGQGRGRGPRPRTLEEDWERWGGGGWNQYPQFPQPPPPPHFYKSAAAATLRVLPESTSTADASSQSDRVQQAI